MSGHDRNGIPAYGDAFMRANGCTVANPHVFAQRLQRLYTVMSGPTAIAGRNN
jgi:hypothetical protein